MKTIKDLFKNRINKNLKKVIFYNIITFQSHKIGSADSLLKMKN